MLIGARSWWIVCPRELHAASPWAWHAHPTQLVDVCQFFLSQTAGHCHCELVVRLHGGIHTWLMGWLDLQSRFICHGETHASMRTFLNLPYIFLHSVSTYMTTGTLLACAKTWMQYYCVLSSRRRSRERHNNSYEQHDLYVQTRLGQGNAVQSIAEGGPGC